VDNFSRSDNFSQLQIKITIGEYADECHAWVERSDINCPAIVITALLSLFGMLFLGNSQVRTVVKKIRKCIFSCLIGG
jgi:hypothetical protein